MILIISTPEDEHAMAVAKLLEQKDAPHYLLDTSLFPVKNKLSIHYDSNEFLRTTWEQVRLDKCKVAWWRRPQQFQLDDSILDAANREFAFNETFAAVSGIWPMLDAYWVNNPFLDDAASKKVYQLKIATQLGLTIPQTLITNNPEEAREFINKRGIEKVICKAFSATKETWRETRLVKQEEFAIIDSVKYAPVIFQEYIEASIDLRITVIGDQYFPAAIHSQASAYKVDYRMDYQQAKILAYTLPEEIESKLRLLMKKLGLVYGAIDMRVRPNGEHVFLEINPSGQWLFMEQPTGMPITEAFVENLIKHNK